MRQLLRSTAAILFVLLLAGQFQSTLASHTYAGQIYWDFVTTGTDASGNTYYDYDIYIQLYYDCEGIDPSFNPSNGVDLYNSCGFPDPVKISPFTAIPITNTAASPPIIYQPSGTYTDPTFGATPEWDDDQFADVSGYCPNLDEYGLRTTCSDDVLPPGQVEVFGLRAVFYRARYRFTESAGPNAFCPDGYWFYYDECCRPAEQESQLDNAQGFDGAIRSKMFNPADMNSSPRMTDQTATVGYQFTPMQVSLNIDDPDPAGVQTAFLGPIRDGAGFGSLNPLPVAIPATEYVLSTPPLGPNNPIIAKDPQNPTGPNLAQIQMSDAGTSDEFFPTTTGSFPFGVYTAEINLQGDTLALIMREEPVYINPALTVSSNYPNVCEFSLSEPSLTNVTITKEVDGEKETEVVANPNPSVPLDIQLCLGEEVEVDFLAEDLTQVIIKNDPVGTCDPSNHDTLNPTLRLVPSFTSSMENQGAQFFSQVPASSSPSTGTMRWEPSAAGVYSFSVEVVSELCPFPRTFALPVRIFVSFPTEIDTANTTLNVNCNEVTITPDTIPSPNIAFPNPPSSLWNGIQVDNNPNNDEFVLVHEYNANGSYPVTLTYDNGTGCISEFDTVVVINNGIDYPDGAGPDITVCNGNAIELGTDPADIPNPNLTYDWTPATDLSSATAPNPVGTFVNSTAAPIDRTYNVEVTDPATGCTFEDSATVRINPTLQAEILGNFTTGNPIEACEGDDVSLEAQIAGNLATPDSYIWSTGDDQKTITLPSVTPNDAGAIQVHIATPNGCISQPASVFLSVTPKPEPVLFGDLNACVGSDAAISAQGGDFFVWAPVPDASNTSGSTVTYEDVVEPINLSVTAFDGNCAGDATTFVIDTVNVPQADFDIAFESGDNEACARVEEVDFTYTGTQPVTDYQWQFANSALPAVSDAENPSGIVFQEAGVFDVIMTATRGNCSNADTQQVTVEQTPVARFFIDDADLCRQTAVRATEEISFFGTPGTYTWEALPDGQPATQSNNSTFTHTYATPGNKTIRLTANIGVCNDVEEKPLIVRPHPAEPELVLDSICNGYKGTTTVLGPFDDQTQYYWYDRRGRLVFGPGRVFETPERLNTTTTYYVEGENRFGCKGPATFFDVLVYPPQARDFEISPPETEIPNAVVTFTADIENEEAVEDILWQFGDRNTSFGRTAVHQYTDPGSFDVALQITDTNGCTSTVLKREIVSVEESVVSRIPTAFSPNGDGLNDRLTFALENITSASFQVYNRQGRQVFSSEGNRVDWDGSFEGETQQEGVYVFLLEYTNYKGESKSFSGTITVIR